MIFQPGSIPVRTGIRLFWSHFAGSAASLCTIERNMGCYDVKYSSTAVF